LIKTAILDKIGGGDRLFGKISPKLPMNTAIILKKLSLSAAVAASTLIILGSLTNKAVAGVITISTSNNAANWLITGAGANVAPAFQLNDSISLTSNGLNSGTFAPGGSLAQFNGFWFADLTFSLPADAKNVVLNLNSGGFDDRAVVQLNGTDIGNGGIAGPGSGLMTFSSGSPEVTYPFTGFGSGIVTSGFNVGGLNTLRLIVNNTSSGIFGTTKTFQGTGDFTVANFSGTVTFDQPAVTTPEPNNILGLGMLGLGALVKRQLK